MDCRLRFNKISEDGTAVPKHVAVLYCSSTAFWYVNSLFVVLINKYCWKCRIFYKKWNVFKALFTFFNKIYLAI